MCFQFTKIWHVPLNGVLNQGLNDIHNPSYGLNASAFVQPSLRELMKDGVIWSLCTQKSLGFQHLNIQKVGLPFGSLGHCGCGLLFFRGCCGLTRLGMVKRIDYLTI